MKQNVLKSSHKSFCYGLFSSFNLISFVFVIGCYHYQQQTYAANATTNSTIDNTTTTRGLEYSTSTISTTNATTSVTTSTRSNYYSNSDKSQSCTFSKYVDPKMLMEKEIKIAPFVGKVYTSQDSEREYQFIVGICQPVIEGTIVAVVQQKLDASGKVNGDINTWSNLGNLKDTDIMLGTDWLFLEYKGGDRYGNHCGTENKRTAIMISCDENVDDNTAKMTFIEEEKAKTDSCYYLFEMKHQAVCPKYSSSSGLSVGSILVIVFFSVLAVYLIVGFAYQRLVLKSKGIEQIPNYQFWKDFGNLQADGCDFVCRTKERRHTIGGLGDDQLDVPEMRDENLLPM